MEERKLEACPPKALTISSPCAESPHERLSASSIAEKRKQRMLPDPGSSRLPQTALNPPSVPITKKLGLKLALGEQKKLTLRAGGGAGAEESEPDRPLFLGGTDVAGSRWKCSI